MTTNADIRRYDSTGPLWRRVQWAAHAIRCELPEPFGYRLWSIFGYRRFPWFGSLWFKNILRFPFFLRRLYRPGVSVSEVDCMKVLTSMSGQPVGFVGIDMAEGPDRTAIAIHSGGSVREVFGDVANNGSPPNHLTVQPANDDD